MRFTSTDRRRGLAALVVVTLMLSFGVSAASAKQDEQRQSEGEHGQGEQGERRGGEGKQERDLIPIQLISISDWHAQLDPSRGEGGAAVLSTYFDSERQANPNTVTFTGGDSFGGSPPLSGFFDERPAVEAMNLMGFDLDGLGNHNWDRGNAHLQEMIDLADFPFVSANLDNVEDNLTGVAPYWIEERAGVRIGFVGVTNPEAPNLVFPGNFGTIEVTDPVRAAKKARNALRSEGVKVTVLIAHMGVTGFDADGAPVGPLIDLANDVGGFDVVAGDHTGIQYSGIINDQLVYESPSRGVTYARASLGVDPRSGKVRTSSVTFVPATASDVVPDQAIVDLLAPLRTQLAAVYDGQIGVATGRFPRGSNVERSGEVAIGNLVADSMRIRYGTQLGMTNAGGIRASLPSSYAPVAGGLDRTDPPPYDLLVGDVFEVLPFGNVVVTRTVTGSQLWAALENGVSQINAATGGGADGRFPQVSGFTFAFSYTSAPGSRVTSVALTDGTPIPNDATTYTFATNDFVNSGGDSYAVLNDGQGVTRDVMADVLLDHIQGLGTITPVIDGRIAKTP